MSENRQRERHKYNKNILCFECRGKDNKMTVPVPFLFSITDISYGGMGIQAKHLIPVGSVLSFRLAEDSEARLLKIEIRWYKRSDDVFVFGAQFKDMVKEDVIFLYNTIHSL